MIIGLIIGGVAAYFAVVTLWNYYQNPEEERGWPRLLEAAKGSATLLWSRFVIVIAGLVGNLEDLVGQLGMPQLKEYLAQLTGNNTKYVAAAVIGIMLLTIVARKRSI